MHVRGAVSQHIWRDSLVRRLVRQHPHLHGGGVVVYRVVEATRNDQSSVRVTSVCVLRPLRVAVTVTVAGNPEGFDVENPVTGRGF